MAMLTDYLMSPEDIFHGPRGRALRLTQFAFLVSPAFISYVFSQNSEGNLLTVESYTQTSP